MTGPDFSMDEVDGELRAMAREAEEAWKQLRKGEDDPGLTMGEWSKLWGITKSGAKRRMKELKAAGMIIEGKRWIRRKDGFWQGIPVYLFEKNEG